MAPIEPSTHQITSSISVSRDLELRSSVRQFAKGEAKLIHSIASVKSEKESESKVRAIIKSKLLQTEEKTGVTSSLDESDIAEYLQEVMQEIKKA
jgi:hypothetical protein